MLTYVSAELYKFTRKKGIFVGVALLILLESVVFLPGVMISEEIENEAMVYLVFLSAASMIGLFLAPLFAVRAFDDQHGHGTLKNEIVYGIPRTRVYLGKLLAGTVMGTLCALLVVGWYLLLTALTTLAYPATAEQWGSALVCMGLCWLSWLSVLSLTFFLLTVIKSSTGAVATVYLLTFIGLPASLIGGAEASSPHWFAVLCRLFYTYPYGGSVWFDGVEYNSLNVTEPYALFVCALWVGGTTALGLALFHRREIK